MPDGRAASLEARRRALSILFAPALLLILPTVWPGRASGDDAPPLTLERASFSGTWRESFLRQGSIEFTGTVAAPAVLRVTVRIGPNTPVVNSTLSIGTAGAFSNRIALPPRPLPGVYELTVWGTSDGTRLFPTTLRVTIPAPAEGIVDKAWMSTTPNGPPLRAVPGPRKKLWATFRFLVPPRDRTNLRVTWRMPSFKFLTSVRKKYSDTIRTYVTSTAPLPRGVWNVFLYSGRKVVMSTAIRIN